MHRLEKRRVEVQTSLPDPGRAIVFGDPHELQQVALNLLLNAADACDERKQGRVTVSVTRTGDEVVLAIADNGIGMSPENQDRCFDIFFTTKPVGEGSGMGLAVVHNIVTNHGGRIEFTSAPGQGTTFQVFLPGEAVPGAAPSTAPEAGGRAS
jgi:signal transduction histidine kinase